MSRSILTPAIVPLALALSAVAGCAGDPDLERTVAPLERVERWQWEPAPPGCESVVRTNVTLAACAGEPLLGALVDRQGRVRCVDSLVLLTRELDPSLTIAPLAGDPSPQPNRPPPPTRPADLW